MKKRIISILLTLCMVLTLLPVTTLAASDTDPTVTTGEDGKSTPAADGVAQIGGINYPTLVDAISAVTDGQTIRLMKNTREKVESNVNVSYAIDLNGKTLAAVGDGVGFNKRGGGTLTIYDSAGGGKITSASQYSTFYVSEHSSGKLVITGGTIENTFASTALWIGAGDVEISGGDLNSAGEVIGKNSKGVLSISGGTIRSTSTYKPGRAIRTLAGSLDISGGTVTSVLGWAIDSFGTDIKISGGMVSGGGIAIEANIHSSVSVSGGSVSGGEYAIYLVGGALNLTGGTVSASGDKTKSAIHLFRCGDLDIKIIGGTVDGGKGYGIDGHTGSLGIADTILSSGVIIKGEKRAVEGTVKFDTFKVKATASLRTDGTSPQSYSKGSATLYRYLKFEPNPIKDAVITITKEPTALTTLTKGKISGSLSVAASINVTDKVQFKYQWYYSKDSSEGKALAGATSATYSFPSTLTAATHYYYCVVSADSGQSARTQVAKVVVADSKAAKTVITIGKQPAASTSLTEGKISGSLTVSASVTNNKKLTYQWAVSISGSKAETAVEIEGATNNTYAFPKNLIDGNYYYFCIIKAEGAEPIMTTVAKVTVKDAVGKGRIVLADRNAQSFSERKAAIVAYYKELNAMAKSLGTKYAVDPVVKVPYAVGELTAEYLAYTTKTLNFVRFLSGLPDDVKTTDELNRLSQHGAILLAAGTFGHTPPQPKDMSKDLYDKGYQSTSKSNIARGYTDLYRSVLFGWMADADEKNLPVVGHRRWALNPKMQYTGFGDAGKNYIMYSADESRTASVDYHAVAYPSGAAFPSDIFLKNYPWSVSLNPALYDVPDKDSVKVSLSGGGKIYEFSSKNSSFTGNYFNVSTDYVGTGSCIIFRPNKDTAYSGEYTVTVTGLKTNDGEDTSLSYTVNFFALNDDAKPDTDKEQPAKPTPDTTKKQPKLKAGVNILSYPKRTVYTLGDGFDPAGLKAVNYVGGKQTSINSKITFYTSRTVQLTKGRPFTTTGKKVVEVRYKGKKIATYTIYVSDKKK